MFVLENSADMDMKSKKQKRTPLQFVLRGVIRTRHGKKIKVGLCHSKRYRILVHKTTARAAGRLPQERKRLYIAGVALRIDADGRYFRNFKKALEKVAAYQELRASTNVATFTDYICDDTEKVKQPSPKKKRRMTTNCRLKSQEFRKTHGLPDRATRHGPFTETAPAKFASLFCSREIEVLNCSMMVACKQNGGVLPKSLVCNRSSSLESLARRHV